MCVGDCHWNICFFRLFQCVGGSFVCHFIWECWTLSVQDSSDMPDLIHWGAWAVISHNYVLALYSTTAGFCPINPGMLINSIFCDSHQKGRKCGVCL